MAANALPTLEAIVFFVLAPWGLYRAWRAPSHLKHSPWLPFVQALPTSVVGAAVLSASYLLSRSPLEGIRFWVVVWFLAPVGIVSCVVMLSILSSGRPRFLIPPALR